MKPVYIFFLTLLGCGLLHAQNGKEQLPVPKELGRAFYEVIYQYDAIDLTTDPSRSIDNYELSVLLIGPEISQYQSYKGFRTDSLGWEMKGKHWSMPELMGLQKQYDLGENRYYILRNHLKGDSLEIKNMTLTISPTQFVKYLSVYESPQTAVEWKISDEHKTIEGVEVTKATGKLHGREWTAWFAESIPYPEGPWELGGLPGLILEASDEDDTHEFTLVQARPVDLPILQHEDKYERTTREAYRKYRSQKAEAEHSDWKRGQRRFPPFMNFIDKE